MNIGSGHRVSTILKDYQNVIGEESRCHQQDVILKKADSSNSASTSTFNGDYLTENGLRGTEDDGDDKQSELSSNRLKPHLSSADSQMNVMRSKTSS